MVPLFGLIVMIFLREALLAQSVIFMNESITVPIPFFYNIPLSPFKTLDTVTHLNVTDCNEWYLFEYNKSTTT